MENNLKRLRRENNVSAWKMAEILNLKTRGAYYKKEQGRVEITLPEAKKISDFYGLSIEEIFFARNCSSQEQL